MHPDCPECGATVAPDGAFCDECGTPVAAVTTNGASDPPDAAAATQWRPVGDAPVAVAQGVTGADATTSTGDARDAFAAEAGTAGAAHAWSAAGERAPEGAAAEEATVLPEFDRAAGGGVVLGRPGDLMAPPPVHDGLADTTWATGYPVPAHEPLGTTGPYGAVIPEYAAPASRRPATWLLLGVAGLALLAGGFFGARVLTAEDEATAAAPAPTASAPTPPSAPSEAVATPTAMPTEAMTAPPTVEAPEAAPPAPPGRPGEGAGSSYRLYHTEQGFGGVFSRAATLTRTTTAPFMANVARAYAESGANGESITLVGVYSPVTGLSYSMTCTRRSTGAVVCVGGNNAEVLLYN
ncbi:zinc ribbon domain-containing protein [Mobilicoccus sp.]|uniref:zinc ribbon domain-containing protein n=1 Tax=Mobilicoccus sp. TaxID=2034349 RepID=UPI0028AC2BCB|nr:zinc ribbon domain-containing protein [Mobilicoccus sp.]